MQGVTDGILRDISGWRDSGFPGRVLTGEELSLVFVGSREDKDSIGCRGVWDPDASVGTASTFNIHFPDLTSSHDLQAFCLRQGLMLREME